MQNDEKVLEQASDTSRIYEVGYHLVPTIPHEHVADRATEIKAQITKNGAEIISEGEPKMTDLAYEILKVSGGTRQNFKTAYFGWVKFECEAAEALAIEKSFKDNENVLRFLLIKTVRENTLADKKLYEKADPAAVPVAGEAAPAAKPEAAKAPAKPEAPAMKAEKPAAPKAEKKAPSVEDMDKTIDGLLA